MLQQHTPVQQGAAQESSKLSKQCSFHSGQHGLRWHNLSQPRGEAAGQSSVAWQSSSVHDSLQLTAWQCVNTRQGTAHCSTACRRDVHALVAILVMSGHNALPCVWSKRSKLQHSQHIQLGLCRQQLWDPIYTQSYSLQMQSLTISYGAVPKHQS